LGGLRLKTVALAWCDGSNRLVEAAGGAIAIDGYDIKDIPLKTLRSKVSGGVRRWP
jgi:ABC-type proline/glycine betaine transport system ATPase subunit